MECLSKMLPIRDALDVFSGKWKLMIIVSLNHGNRRFREIERSIPKISSKVLAKELRELEEHRLIERTVYDEKPVLVEYTLTPYSKTLEHIITALHAWGVNHRKVVMGK
jgi:DNA-binding HxlR family transcriptional regulator